MLDPTEEYLGVGMEFVVVEVSFAVENMIGCPLCRSAFCEVKDLNSKALLYLIVYPYVIYLTWETIILALVRLKEGMTREPCVLLNIKYNAQYLCM